MNTTGKRIELDWKKYRILGFVCLAASLLCLIGFGVSGIVNSPKGAEKFLIRYEKLCKAGDIKKLSKLYVKEKGVNTEERVVIPFDGYQADFLYEGLEENEDGDYQIRYTAYYEFSQQKNIDGQQVEAKVPFCYTGNTVNVKKTLFGYRIIAD